jgi:DNA-binding transcriptional MerR regulator
MINTTRSPTRMSELAELSSREIQLFEPPADALYTIEATSRIVDVPRRTILVYCKYRLLSPAPTTADHGYYFNGNAVRTLRRIEALRTVCGDDFAGIKIILDLTAALERLRADLRLLSRAKRGGSYEKDDREISSVSPRRFNVKSSSRRKRK